MKGAPPEHSIQLGWRFPRELPERGRRVCLGELLCEADLEKPLVWV
jgi:hypothetical protein